MSDPITPDRIRIISEAARVPLSEEAQARVARAVTPPATRFAAGPVAIPFETEPSTFLLVQRSELKR